MKSGSAPVSALARQTNAAARHWIVTTEEIVTATRPTPPAQARMYAAVASIFADAAALKPGDPDSIDQADAATVAVLRHTLGSDAKNFESKLNLGGRHVALWEETQKLVDTYFARLDSDVNVNVHDGAIPAGLPAGSWVRTGTTGPFEPDAGKWSYWLAERQGGRGTAAAAVPAPPKFGTAEYDLQLQAVRAAVAKRDAKWIAAINRWGGAPGTQGPAGIWLDRFDDELGNTKAFDDPNFARNQAILAKTIADAFIAAWDVKYQYWTQRPDQADPTITTSMPNPPFPSYVSGHSTISAAAATVLGALYPKHALALIHNAEEARDSRLYAGIHFPVDNEAGFALGTALGNQVIARLGITNAGAVAHEVAVIAQPLGSAASAGTAPLVITRYKSSGVSDDAATGGAALVRVTNEALGLGFVFGVEGNVLPALRYQPGWTAKTISTDPTWTPGLCGDTPNVLIDRYEATIEYKSDTSNETYVRVFDTKEKNFFDVASSKDGLGTPQSVLARGNALLVLRSAPGSAVIQRFDFGANTVVSTPIAGIGIDMWVRLDANRGGGSSVLEHSGDVLIMSDAVGFDAKFATVFADGTVSAWTDIALGTRRLLDDGVAPRSLGPKLQARLVRRDAATGHSDYEILDLKGKRLRLLTAVFEPQFLGTVKGFAVIEFMNQTTTPGILSQQEMFFDTSTGDWYRVFDLGADIPASQVPEPYRSYQYDANIFVAGAVSL
ncbi:MAG: phosphatase PAP2 family protein [Acidimicrobiia bacterium]